FVRIRLHQWYVLVSSRMKDQLWPILLENGFHKHFIPHVANNKLKALEATIRLQLLLHIVYCRFGLVQYDQLLACRTADLTDQLGSYRSCTTGNEDNLIFQFLCNRSVI